MLIAKLYIHCIYILKKQNNILLPLVCYTLKKTVLYLFYLFNIKCLLKKKQTPQFFFRFKINSLNKIFFNQVLFKILDNIKYLNIIILSNFSHVKSKKKKYTVLRSPFVYKKSKEQFFFEKFNGFFSFYLVNKNSFFIDFLETIWLKALIFPFDFKLFVKKIIKL